MIKKKVEDIEESEVSSEELESGALIVMLEENIRVLVYQKPKPREFLLQKQIAIKAPKDGKKYKKDEIHNEWINVGSLGDMSRCIKIAAEQLVHGRLKEKRIIALKEYIIELRKAEKEFNEIVKELGVL